MREISNEDSKRLGKKLSEEHPTTVYAMAQKASSFKQSITSSKVRSVTAHYCELALVTCRGDLCEMKTVQYPLVSPLESSIADWTPKRIATLHVDACTPKFSWLMTTPLALFVLCLCSSISYGALVLGMDGIVNALSSAPRLEQGVESIFGGSTAHFANAVVAAWWVQTIAHTAEACFAYRKSTTVLKLPTDAALKWSFLVLLTGYPMLSRLLNLVQFEHQHASKKDS